MMTLSFDKVSNCFCAQRATKHSPNGLNRESRTIFGLKKKMIVEVVMKVDHREKLSFPIGLLAQDSLSGVAEQVKEVFTTTHADDAEKDKPSCWQLIFLQSKANGCCYRGESLPHAKWQWPRDTWFQEQLEHRLKALASNEEFTAMRHGHILTCEGLPGRG